MRRGWCRGLAELRGCGVRSAVAMRCAAMRCARQLATLGRGGSSDKLTHRDAILLVRSFVSVVKK